MTEFLQMRGTRHSMLASLVVFAAAWTLISDARADERSPGDVNPLPSQVSPGAEKTTDERPDIAVAVESVAQLAQRVQKSMVLLKTATRDGSDHAIGAGFVIDDSGLVVTARHVIGDGREIRVQLPDQTTAAVVEVFASSGQLDLAVIRIDEHSLPPLEIGAVNRIVDGLEVVTVGHPRGFRNSVVSGVISGRREIDGLSMLQLAMPIEPGNSGGPVVDRQGRVVGIVTMKSTASDNLGFAIPVDVMAQLLSDPNPVPMSRWRTIGALDSRLWTTLFGANWRQRAGRISVDGTGQSFGGRSLCVKSDAPDRESYEWQASVKLQDEQGAAGLIFHSDAGERHYGFYPSAGNLRFTRFDGPDVNSWTILHNEPHPAYRPGEWNTLKVRIEPDRVTCFVNDQQVLESSDAVIPNGTVGLATFRGTQAEFRHILLADRIEPHRPASDVLAKLQKAVSSITTEGSPDQAAWAALKEHPRYSAEYLDTEAHRLRQMADRLEQLRSELHQENVIQQLADVLQGENTDAGSERLLHAALLVSQLDNVEVDVDAYLARVEQMADEIRQQVPVDTAPQDWLKAIDDYLFTEYGFRGSRFEYYSRSNSYINEVIDDREGLPITLSVLYISLGQRLGLKIAGVGMPGHFVVRYEPQDVDEQPVLIDPFERGQRLTVADAMQRLRQAGYPPNDSLLRNQTTREIIERMLRNLLNLAEQGRSDSDVLRYLEALVAILPDNPEYRAKRLEIRARTGHLQQALEDADWFLQMQPDGTDQHRLIELRAVLQNELEVQQKAQQQPTSNAPTAGSPTTEP